MSQCWDKAKAIFEPISSSSNVALYPHDHTPSCHVLYMGGSWYPGCQPASWELKLIDWLLIAWSALNHGRIWWGSVISLGLRPGTHFTNGWWAYKRNFVKRKLKYFSLTFILIIQTVHKFAHVTTAELSWHVQNCDLIWWLFSNFHSEEDIFFTKCGLQDQKSVCIRSPRVLL